MGTEILELTRSPYFGSSRNLYRKEGEQRNCIPEALADGEAKAECSHKPEMFQEQGRERVVRMGSG